MQCESIKELLDYYVEQYNIPGFIEEDPISIPHAFSQQQDIEIAGLFAATFAWGNRKTIIKKASLLMQLMDNAPYEFVKDHTAEDRSRFADFVHRTFQYTDTLYFLTFLQHHFRQTDSLEDLFIHPDGLESGLIQFEDQFFALPDAPKRTRKHVPSPARKSTCKRLNMFLRWMVRNDGRGVDFGIWKNIKPSQLFIPLDVHVDRVARSMGLIQRKQTDWQTTVELTHTLRVFDDQDPVKYDYALFGLGVLGKHDPWQNAFVGK